MRVNFILTCCTQPEQIPAAVEVLRSYAAVQPRWAVCYNGVDPSVPCDCRLRNRGLHRGDRDLTVRGYRWLRGDGCFRYAKLSVDSWLLDEQVILDVFREMEGRRVPYAGNRWDADGKLATDVFFADLRFGDLFRRLRRRRYWMGKYERRIYLVVDRLGAGWYEIPERHPVHPNNRFCCPALHWTMFHRLEDNLRARDHYRRHGTLASFRFTAPAGAILEPQES
jgi:hypothetical protein